ncbi:MAG: hypothetical protein P0Y65_05945 [Candidatus Devosia phytovorans]|uniref:Uncharacterized protein n=1 Tax=Candidatus Devosia phytovorans TaxID=3121372 RepID=A0AAJ6B111_9HYPH|nr:hypothetical protein [Devosia sp.]WEK05797.1 MAG: hypothetical protein P0Y65_05945 [Devosia sp.]
MNFKRISENDAAELTDSILVSVAAEGGDEPSAGVIWMAEGNIVSDEGPLDIPAAMVLATTLADEQGRNTVYVLCEPEDMVWKDEWGAVN